MNRQDAKKNNRNEPDEVLDQLARDVIGAAIEVHRILGPGFLESVYEEALSIELKPGGTPFKRQLSLGVQYKGERVGEGRMDIPVKDALIVELKTVDSLAPIHKAQTISYLKATGLKLAPLVNFNVPVLKEGIKRIIFS
jgi:GxxExxY protein